MGTPSFAMPTLDALRQAGHGIIAVCTQPDRPAGRSGRPAPPPVKCRAREISCPVHQPEDLAAGGLEPVLRELSPDLLVVVAYGLKLPRRILDLPRQGAVNLHPSLLPRYRGAAPINRAIINGDRVTGVTTMFLSPRMDAGDVILQEPVEILPDETAGELETRLALFGAELMVRTVGLIAAGDPPRKPQDESLATVARKLGPEDGRIDWRQPSGRIRDLVRGLAPKPGAFTLFRGQRLEISRAEGICGPENQGAGFVCGRICRFVKGRGPVVSASDGGVLLAEVKPAGSKTMAGAAFINGYRPEIGEELG